MFRLYEEDEAVHHPCPARRQQHVHARFLGVDHLEGVGGGEEGGQQTRRLAVQPPADEVDQPDQQYAQRGGEGAQADLAAAEDPRPAMQQPVVERRVNVVSGIVSDLHQRAAGQRGAVPLVGPEALAVQAVATQGQGQQDGEEQEDATKSITHRSVQFGHLPTIEYNGDRQIAGSGRSVMDELKETLALYRVRPRQLAEVQDQDRTIYQAATSALGHVPAVEGILIEQEGDIFTVWTVVDRLGEQTEARIYQMEGKLMDQFPAEGFDFHILVRRGRPLEEFVGSKRSFAFSHFA